MPLTNIINNESFQIAIWDVVEPPTYFKKKIALSEKEKQQTTDLRARKHLEWLSSRYVIHLMTRSEDRFECEKDQYGKPFLKNIDYNISLSHSKTKVACIVSDNNCGIDIQNIVPKIQRIKHKYATEQELQMVTKKHELLFLHILWGAKECIYKCHGRRAIDYKRNIAIDPISLPEDSTRGNFTASLNHKDVVVRYQLSFRIIGNFVLTFANEI